MGLLGSNKKMDTQRMVSNVYQSLLNQVGMRYEPIPQRNPRGYTTRAEHVSFQTMVEQCDIQSADRVLVDNRIFVVAGVSILDDAMGKHLEFVMREINSKMHQTVTRKILAVSQPSFDPLFQEWQPGTSKVYTTVPMSVLLDQAQNAKQRYKMLIEAGKFNDIEFAMTVDYPDDIKTDDRIIFNGKIYKVAWVENLVWEKIAGLEADVDQMPTDL